MPVIKIDTDLLQASSSQIASKLNELEELNSNLSQMIEMIKDGWEGEYSEKYYGTMKQYLAKANQMKQVFAQLKKYSDDTVSKFDSLDKASASRIRNSF